MLWYHINRLKRSKLIDKLVIATTVNRSDDPIVEYCKELGVETFRGDEHNVLDRYYRCAQKFNATDILRVTSDCPLIDPALIDQLISAYQRNHTEKYDYLELCPKTYPSGFDAELFSYQCLERAIDNTGKAHQLEHVTSYFYENPNLFSIGKYSDTKEVNTIKLSVDTIEDFKTITSILQHFNKSNNLTFSWKDCVSYAKAIYSS